MAVELPLTVDNIDLRDEELFELGYSTEAFRILRNERPVSWNPPNEYVVGVWNLVKYEDVMFVSRRPDLFSSEEGIVQYRPIKPDEATAAAEGDGKMLITMDPPRHVKLRRLVNKGFTPRAVGAMEEHIREITRQLMDDISEKDSCDFVIEVASQLPLAVICGMMGLEKKDWPLMFQLTNKVLGSGDPEYQTDVPEEERGTPEAARITGNMGTMQMFAFFSDVLNQRKAQRRDDLISLLVDSEIDGDQLTDEDILWFCFLLILAGNETTRNGISGGLITMFEHPDQLEELKGNLEGLLPSAVEEILRWVSPVTHMARVATEDTEIRGQKIAKGDRLVMWYPAINRDEDIFPNSETFDIHRSPNDHLAFGIGEHFCLGAGFARLEIKVLLEELLTRFPNIHQNGQPERLRSTFLGGIKHLPVAYQPVG